MKTRFSQLSHHLYVHHGHVNTGILRDGNRALLIDASGNTLHTTLAELGITTVEHILFTHHHRDSVSGFPIPDDARVGVPAKGREWFSHVEAFWHEPKYRWHLYNYRPHNLMLANSIRVTDTYTEGAQIAWGAASLTVLETPGHTDESVTYLIDVDDKRFAFCGDLIYDEGTLWELYSLQKGQQTSDYHGFLGARNELTESLEKIRGASPTALIPTHGVVMNTPDRAIDTLLKQLEHCYDKYVAISALRYYFPKLFAESRPEGAPTGREDTEISGTRRTHAYPRRQAAARILTPLWYNVANYLRDRRGIRDGLRLTACYQTDSAVANGRRNFGGYPVLGDALPR